MVFTATTPPLLLSTMLTSVGGVVSGARSAVMDVAL